MTIQQLIDQDRQSSSALMEQLKKHIQKTTSSGYSTAAIMHSELLQRSRDFTEIIASIKAVQWRIVNYAVLLFAATVGIPTVINLQIVPQTMKTLVTIILAVLDLGILWVAIRMIAKTEADLSFYREHGRNNDILLSATTGIQHIAGMIIEKTNEKYQGTADYKASARKNWMTFTRWFYITIIVSGILSAILSIGRIWIN
jgi:hypothetical protein